MLTRYCDEDLEGGSAFDLQGIVGCSLKILSVRFMISGHVSVRIFGDHGDSRVCSAPEEIRCQGLFSAPVLH